MEKKIAVIIEVDEPTPIAYINVVEDDDRWEKVQGCDDCPVEQRVKCCGKICYHLIKGGRCGLHMGGIAGGSAKPFYCIVFPNPKPTTRYSHCIIQYKCVKGSELILGKVRRVCDPRGELIDVG